jgi:class 3 adenylate cyclase
VIAPALAAGKGAEELGNVDLADRISPMAEQTVLAMYHAHQGRAWTANIIEGFELLMAKAGIHSRLERLPAICFLDISGYTRLTQERGDDAAAELASTVARLVRRSSVEHGGKPIKWLGDGVMFYFPDPGEAVRSSLEMVAQTGSAGLPPAHVGLHAGPVVQQDGDFFGRTVNLASRVAGRAGGDEVLVTDDVLEVAAPIEGVRFRDAGPADLKNVAHPVRLWRAEAWKT